MEHSQLSREETTLVSSMLPGESQLRKVLLHSGKEVFQL